MSQLKKYNILLVHLLPALKERMTKCISDEKVFKYCAGSLEEASEFLAGMKFDIVLFEDTFAADVLKSADQGLLHYLSEQNIPYLFISDKEYQHSLSLSASDEDFRGSIEFLLAQKSKEREINDERLKLLKALAVSINHKINNPLTIALLA